MLPGRLPWQTSSATLLARGRDGGQSGLAEQEMLSLRSAPGILLVPALLLFRYPRPPGMKERGEMPTVSYGLGDPTQGSPNLKRRPFRAGGAEWGPPEPLLLERGGEGGLDTSAASLA